ncbi:multidrug efflux MFS transporter [Sphingomonas sp. AP4-R1]|uniref:MDR family MFS transporter n=1 Tax=Sphingomonas sp. AP4-R1 TaxID=2735134 RepID=UPI001493C1CC|nr:MDR family MFS transporter [Sphingomonas sp. AP4-R1]QJU58744.1 multidrug efflux MFS transporter [Sphingomonas sp. AP4-R1]
MSGAAAGAAPASPPAPPARADFAAWLAVAAGTIGAFMATLDISIVNSALPTIQGEIGASGTEGTWIATAYLVAEIIMIPLAGWLERLVGLRTFLMIMVSLFTAFSMMCGFSTTLPMMIVGRVGQGFTGGALIPTAMSIIATRLPPHQQPVGIAAFGFTAITGPVFGPVIGGWLAENVSWHYAFFLNLPVGVVLLCLLTFGLPAIRSQLHLLREADWFGIAGIVFFLGGLTVFLEEGEREQWFDSTLIVIMAGVSLTGFVSLMIGQAVAERPVLRLRLLLDRQFGAVIIMAIVVGMALYGTSFIIPQFLTAIAGYNALQSGGVVFLAGIPAALLMLCVPWLLRNIDVRVMVMGGLGLLAFSCWLETDLTAFSAGDSFTHSQLIRGLGQTMAMMFLNQAAVSSVPVEYARDAAGLFSTARNLGGSLALAGISVVQDERMWLHQRRLEEALPANSLTVQDYMNGQAMTLGGMPSAYRSLAGTIQTQALTLTYVDMFWILTVGVIATLPLALLLRPLPKRFKPAEMGH